MPEPLSAERTAEMLLWYFQQPTRFRAEGRRRDAPLLDSTVVLKLALGRRARFADPAMNGDEVAAALQRAAATYVRLLFFHPEATPYQTLGLAPGASAQAIKESFRLLMQLVHPDRQDARPAWPDSFAAQANRAYGVLRDQDSRTRFDRDAEVRAAMARAVHRTSAAAAASMMPVVLNPRPRRRGRALGGAMLPEWLTAGVGGYVREHPAPAAFALLTLAAVLTVVAMMWEGQDGWLTRDVAENHDVASPAVGKSTATSLPAFDGSAPAPVASANAGASPKRAIAAESPVSPPTDSTASTEVALPIASDAISRSPGPVPEALAIALESPSPLSAPPPAAAAAAPVSVPLLATVPVVANAPAANVAVTRAEPAAQVPVSTDASSPPATMEIEALFATFVESYERGRADAFAALFDDDADANLRHGRTAIRGEYDELFRLSQWRRMQLTRVNWKRVGDKAIAKGEIIVRIGWRDGREVEQRLALDMELVRRDGRVVIARLTQQPKNY